jgi:transcriptional regulator with XRE-family HTH domain
MNRTDREMAKRRTFGQSIRERRHQSGLTQRQLALRIEASTQHLGHLETNKRHPSDKILERLADVLDLDPRDLFMTANPVAACLVKSAQTRSGASAWNALRKDKDLQRRHNITPTEMKFLTKVAKMGEVASERDFLQILTVLRYILRR